MDVPVTFSDAMMVPLSAAQRVQGTLVGTILLPQLPPASLAGAGIFQLDDRTNATRLTLRVLPTGAVRLVGSGAATALDLAVGSVTAGAVARFAVSYGTDGVAACLNGGGDRRGCGNRRSAGHHRPRHRPRVPRLRPGRER